MTDEKKFGLLGLRAAISPPYITNPEKLKERHKQIANGILKLVEFGPKLKEAGIDVYFLDNTIGGKEKLPECIREALAHFPDALLEFGCPNRYGKHNKGAGEIEGLLHMEKTIQQYQWFIHFEPRQLFSNFNFLESFLRKPRNLFTTFTNPEGFLGFNTGLYATESKNVSFFLDLCRDHRLLQDMVIRYRSYEYILFNFYEDHRLLFDTLPKMGVLWYDGDIVREM